MQFYTVEQVTEMVLYTRQHLGRLERAGKLPQTPIYPFPICSTLDISFVDIRDCAAAFSVVP